MLSMTAKGDPMRTTPRIAFITLACALPVVLALASLGSTRFVIWLPETNEVVTVNTPSDNGGGVQYWVCSINLPNCVQLRCIACHTAGQDRSKEVYTVANHEKVYYPRITVIPAAGQRLSWGDDGGYLVSNAGRFEYFRKDGSLSLIAPTGSSLLKDAAGKPFLLWMPGEPTLHPKPR
jgi:nitrate reductase NapE component